MKGEVIGINNSIASNGGGNEGVGFSIPINLARWIMSQLVANGRVSRGALGRRPPPRVPARGRPRPGPGPARGRLDRVGPPRLARRRQAGLQRRRRGPPVQRGRGHRPEPPDQHGLDGPDRPGRPRWSSGATASEMTMKVTVGDRDRIVAQASPPAEPRPPDRLRATRPARASRSRSTGAGTGHARRRRRRAARASRGAARGAVMKVEPDSPLAAIFRRST